jgi:hypothetical protein
MSLPNVFIVIEEAGQRSEYCITGAAAWGMIYTVNHPTRHGWVHVEACAGYVEGTGGPITASVLQYAQNGSSANGSGAVTSSADVRYPNGEQQHRVVGPASEATSGR